MAQTRTKPAPKPKAASLDEAEVAKFAAMAAEWWDPKGKFKPLHVFNPVRLNFIRREVCEHFGLSMTDRHPFAGKKLLDIGCGGGLLSLPMARLGADVTGVDAAEANIGTARHQAKAQVLDVDFRHGTAEELAETHEDAFDIILNMEVIEHTADRDSFLSACTKMLKPGGIMVVATLNRTQRARALAIFAAERVLKWLPAGTHEYEKLVKPQEIRDPLEELGLTVTGPYGVSYNPITRVWSESRDTGINYMMLATK